MMDFHIADTFTDTSKAIHFLTPMRSAASESSAVSTSWSVRWSFHGTNGQYFSIPRNDT